MKASFVEAVIEEIIKPVLPKEWLQDTKYLVNPTGRFVIGGPQGDCGLTGRKIIVDTYGGACPHGGGAFSGKDPSKVDRSAAYAARYVAKNIVAAGLARQCQVQVAYAIGVAKPMNVTVYTEGTGKIPDERIAEAGRSTSTCARAASSRCSTCCARSTRRPPPTATSAAPLHANAFALRMQRVDPGGAPASRSADGPGPACASLLLNPPHTAIGSRIPREHLPPLGLLSVGGPLLDARLRRRIAGCRIRADGGRRDHRRDRAGRAARPAAWCGPFRLDHPAHPDDRADRRAKDPRRACRPCASSMAACSRPTTGTMCWNRNRPSTSSCRGEGERNRASLGASHCRARRSGQRARHRLSQRRSRGHHRPGGDAGQPRRCPRGMGAHRPRPLFVLGRAARPWWCSSRGGCPYLCSYCGQRGFWTRWAPSRSGAVRGGAGAAASRAWRGR
jgi:hypothetical protein